MQITELLNWLLCVALTAGGCLLAQRSPSAGLRSARFAAVLAVLTWISAAGSGLVRALGDEMGIHFAFGQGLLIAVWLLTPFLLGVALAQWVQSHWRRALGQIFLLLSLLVLCLLSSFTGYLGPTHSPAGTDEARLRFVALHLVLLPLLQAAVIAAYCWTLRIAQPPARALGAEPVDSAATKSHGDDAG